MSAQTHDQWVPTQTTELAYTLGLLWADGHISKKYIGLTLIKEDADSIESIIKCIPFGKYWYPEKRGTVFFKVGHRAIRLFLGSMDFRIKSQVAPKKILEWLLPELIPYFLMGYLDGDGYVMTKRNKGVTFTASHDYDWSSFTTLFESIVGIAPKIIRRAPNKHGHRNSFIYYYGKPAVKLLDFIYQSQAIGFPRKYERYQELKMNKKLR